MNLRHMPKKQTLFLWLKKKEVDLCMKMDGFKKKDGIGQGHMVWQLWTMSQLFISILMKQKIIVNGIKKEFLQKKNGN